jgi:hypothetical protein
VDLIERYLANVRILLPKSQRDDIIAELRDVLTGCRDEEAAKLGHPLTRAEQESLLRGFGHPVLVAGRYRPQQYLIGPELYPLYSFILKVALAIVAGAALLVGIIVGTVASGGVPDTPVGIAVRIAWNGTFGAIGSITLIFAILQRYSKQLQLFTNWPHDPPGLKEASRRVTHFSNHIAGIVANAVFILAWIRLVPISSVLPADEGQGLHVSLAPVWQTLYVPVLVAALYAIAVHTVRLTEKGRGRLGHALDLALQILVLIVFTIALYAGHWVLVMGIGVPNQAVANVDRALNMTVQLTLLVVGCVAVSRTSYDLWNLLRSKRPVNSAST